MTNRREWSEVDSYFTRTMVAADPALEEALAANAAAGLPSIDVSAPQGKLLHLMARMTGAKKALEIGTLGGYSTIWLAARFPTTAGSSRSNGAAGTPRSRAATSPAPAFRPRSRSDRARRSRRCRRSRPRGSARSISSSSTPTRSNNAAYLEWALRLSRRGTAIVVDNVVRDGEVADARSADPDVVGVRRMFDLIAREKRLSATAIQTVGAKGWDGFALAVVK